MEENQLLRVLILSLLSSLFFNIVLAEDSNSNWAKGLAKQSSNISIDNIRDITTHQELDSKENNSDWAQGLLEQSSDIVMDNIKEIANQQNFDSNLAAETLKPRPCLQIFVSSSMPKQLLKSYADEAKHYGGVLVFIGLPGGSIHKLSELVMEISTEDSAAMQIDDEAFNAFGITGVPAIVLANAAPIFEGKTMSEKFDKVTGCISIKGALELFSASGEMAKEARGLLK